MNFGRAVGSVVLTFSCLIGYMTPEVSSPSARIAVSDGWLAMGTFFEADLRVRSDEAERARAWLDWARLEIARLERVYSRYDPDSAISALNRELARGEAVRKGVRLDSDLESILFSAIEVWADTEGAFDITVGPLIEVWQDAAEQGIWPTVEGLRETKRRVGSEGLLLLGNGRLDPTMRGIRIDLDGIAKGAVLDHLRERFEADFETEVPGAAALLSFGQSSVIAIGDPDGDGWKLVVRSRNPSVGPLTTVRLRNQALSVSSSVGSVREIAGERVSHVIDPQTGGVVEGSVEAIVVGDRAAIVDGWSTALLVLGANQTALRLVAGAGLEAYVLESSGRSIRSAGWEPIAPGDR